jgi:hypothetical protein
MECMRACSLACTMHACMQISSLYTPASSIHAHICALCMRRACARILQTAVLILAVSRDKPGVTKSQPGFVDFVVRPLFEVWVACFPEVCQVPRVHVFLILSLDSSLSFPVFMCVCMHACMYMCMYVCMHA